MAEWRRRGKGPFAGVLLLFLLLALAPVHSAAEDAPLFDESLYVVGLVSDDGVPADVSPAGPAVRTVEMTGRDGATFLCDIPLSDAMVAEREAEGAGEAETREPQAEPEPEEEEKGEEEAAPAQTPSKVATVRELVEAANLGEKPCLQRKFGYWTYEVCPFRSVEQFHRDPKTSLVGATFKLGTYRADKTASRGPDHYAHAYMGGDGGRVSVVSFVCNDGQQQDPAKHFIRSVKEPETHRYQIVVATPAACREAPPGGAADGSFGDTASRVKPGSPVALMAPMEKRCLRSNAGWWTYEVCYLNRVRQFHVEVSAVNEKQADGTVKATEVRKTVAEHVLGSFPERHSRVAAKRLTSVVHPGGPRTGKSYASQWYENGDKCDLTGHPRRTELRVRCNPDAERAQLVSVTESSTCQYVALVEGPELCAHDDFRPRSKPMRTIVCRPADRAEASAAE